MPVSPRQPGTKSEGEPTQNILAMNISGGAAGVSINFTNGDPLPVGGFYSDASIVELDGPHGSDPLVTTATAAMLGNDVIRYSANTTLTDNLTSDGGILAISGTTTLNNPADDSLHVAAGATVLINGSQTFSSLTIDGSIGAAGLTTDISDDGTYFNVGLPTDASYIAVSTTVQDESGGSQPAVARLTGQAARDYTTGALASAVAGGLVGLLGGLALNAGLAGLGIAVSVPLTLPIVIGAAIGYEVFHYVIWGTW